MSQRTRLIPPADWVELERLTIDKEIGWILTGAGLAVTLIAGMLFGALAEALSVPLYWERHAWAAWVLGTLMTFPAHEAVHGLAAMRYGARPRYGVGMAGILPYAYCAPEWNFRRNQHLVVVLAPLVVLDLLALIALPFPALAPVAFAVLVVNTAGAVGDLWMAYRILRYPPDLIIVEEGMITRLMGPPDWRRPARAGTWSQDLGHGLASAILILLFLCFLWIPLDLAFRNRPFRLELLPVPGLRLLTITGGGAQAGVSFRLDGLLAWLPILALSLAWLRRWRRLRSGR